MQKSEKGEVKLNAEQSAAVNHDRGPLLVVAGAGTGKTSVIVERIRRLVAGGCPPARILALTFTEKAAAEMQDRVNALLGTYQIEIPLLTFNAYGENLLRRYAIDIGLSPGFSLMGEAAQLVFLRERLDQLGLEYFSPISRPDGLLADIAAYFSLLKQNVITPDRYVKFAKSMPTKTEAEKLEKTKHIELATAFNAYVRLSREAGFIDYDDQIYLAIELLTKRPNVLAEVMSQIDYIMVDEFQDTNLMQSTLVDMITGKGQNLFVVGDDDQSIYGWRGATLANILDFKQRYPKTAEVTLSQNYRSSQQILDRAYSLIQSNNPHRLEVELHIDKHLTGQKTGPEPSVHCLATLDDELQWIASDIKKRLDNGADPGSIAILARRSITISQLQAYLDYEQVPYSVAGERYNLYKEPAVQTVIEALRAVSDPHHNLALYHTLSSPLFNVPIGQLSRLSRLARAQHETLLDIIDQAPNAEAEEAKKAVSLIKSWHEKSGSLSVGKLAYEIIDQTGYKDYIYSNNLSDPLLLTAGIRVSELFQSFRDFEAIAIKPTVQQYHEALPALISSGENVDDGTLELGGDSVNLLTIHKAKGLEWETVYIADCSEGSFPLRDNQRGLALPAGLKPLTTEADAHLAEERRLMYVAMTRARDNLIMTYAQTHTGRSQRKPSRFLAEAFGDKLPEAAQPKTGNSPKLFFDQPSDLLAAAVKLPDTILSGDMVTLSVSQMTTYLDCPLNFYYCYVLNIPIEPDAAQEYGSLMHRLQEQINRSLQAGEEPDKSQLYRLLEKGWPRVGYHSKDHEARALKQAKNTLKNLLEAARQNPRVPLEIEEKFSCTLDDGRLQLNGRFDVVLPYEDSVEIVDYKTGDRVTSAEKAKQRAVSSKQLTLYALAWQELHGELPARVSLEFIDTGFTGSVKKTQRGIETMHANLLEVAEGIRSHRFKPGQKHTYCKHPEI